MNGRKLVILVNDNPNTGKCSNSKHFEDEWGKTGILFIDDLPVTIDKKAIDDTIKIQDAVTKEILHTFDDGETLLLNNVSLKLQEILEIDVLR